MSFKRPFTLTNRSSLSGSAQKKFKKQLLSDFPALSEEDVELLIPKKAAIVVDKLSNKRVSYLVEEVPLFFDNTNGKGELFPSVYCLWIVPHILPKLIVHWQVSKFIVGGADVMLPGVIGGLAGSFEVGNKYAVCCLGNEAAVCVGTMAVSSKEVDPKAKNQGKGLIVLHHYGDTLWDSGPGTVPNEGFLRDRVVAIQTPAQIPQYVKDLVGSNVNFVSEEVDEKEDETVTLHAGAATSSPENERESEDGVLVEVPGEEVGGRAVVVRHDLSGVEETPSPNNENKEAQGKEGVTEGAGSEHLDEKEQAERAEPQQPPQQEGDEAAEAEEEGEGDEDNGEAEGDEKGEEHGEEKGEKKQEAKGPCVEEMDEALTTAFLFALSSRVGPAELPLECSTLMSLHLPACNLARFRLDVKKSSFKQLAKFVQAMDKRGLIRAKNNRGVLSIISVNAEHPDLAGFRVTKEMTARAKKNVAQSHESHSEAAGAASHAAHTTQQRQVLWKYKPNANLRAIFPENADALYTQAEASQVLLDYCKKEGLDRGQDVQLDPHLAKLFAQPPVQVGKGLLVKKFREALVPHYAIVCGDEADVKYRSGPLPKISVQNMAVPKQSKKITKVTGLEVYGVSPEEFSGIIPKKFATSCTLAPMEGKKNVGKSVVTLQGNFVNEVVQCLHAEYGIPLASFDR